MFNNSFNFKGDYFNLEISDQAIIKVAGHVTFNSFSTIEIVEGAQFVIGDRVSFNTNCVIRCHNKIEIGKDTMFGDGVKIYDFNHTYTNYHVEKLSFNSKPIKIGSNCWIGANSVILKGVTIGDNVIIGAGCTIYKDIPDNSIVTSTGIISIRDRRQYKYNLTTFTASDSLEHLEYLVKQLPDCSFNIVAGVYISSYLETFRKYNNVNIYSNIHDWDVEEDILNRTNIYLDINYSFEVKDVLQRAKNKNIPILAFDSVCHNYELADKIIPVTKRSEMIAEISNILNLDNIQ